MILDETYKLNNGVNIPRLGLGTWFMNDRAASEAVKEAAKIGYRLIDTAEIYGNESGVGEGIRSCGVPRDEMFVTTKIAAGAKTYGKAEKCIDGSLEKLGIGHIDLMIIHSPRPWMRWENGKNRYYKENFQVWKALEDAYAEGKLRAIGVSNFHVDDLQNILDNCDVRPAVNQVLNHAGNVPGDLIEFCKRNDILVESYSPLGHGKLLKNEEMAGIANRYGVSVPQLCMRFVVQMGTVAIPKASSPEHMRNNADVDFEITTDDMRRLESISFDGYGIMSIIPVFSRK